MKALTRAQAVSLFWRLRADLGDTEEAVWTLFELARGAGESTARLHATKTRINLDLAAEAKRSAEFLRRRWIHLFEAVAARHGVTVDEMLECHPGLKRGSSELCWLLRTVARLSYLRIGEVTGRNHATAIQAVQRTERRFATDPGLREELLALAGGERVEVVRAAAGGAA